MQTLKDTRTGKNGGRPKKETNGFEKNKTTGFDKEITKGYVKTETKTKPNVNVNENVNVNVNANVNGLGFEKVIECYENNIAPATAMSLEILQDYCKELSPELVVEAIKKAVLANKRNGKYIEGILNSWKKQGFKTLIDIQNEEENFKKSKEKKDIKNNINAYEQRNYTDFNFDSLYANKQIDESNESNPIKR